MKSFARASLQTLLIISCLTLISSAQNAPLGIVVTPSDLTVTVATDQSSYPVGAHARVSGTVNQTAFLYLVNVDAVNRVMLIFPNAFSQNNLISTGSYAIPDTPAYHLTVQPPTGTEFIYAIASTVPLDLQTVFSSANPFATLGNPQQATARIQAAIQALVPTAKVAVAFTSIFTFGGPIGNRHPVAHFTFSPANPQVGQPVLFNASGSFDPDGDPIVQYLWDFNGDGIFDATGIQVSRTFNSPGTRLVRLRVVDARGGAGEQTRLLTVSFAAQAPRACFTINPNPATMGQNVVFNAACSSDPDGFIVSYWWDFNSDGIVDAVGQQIVRRFNSAGVRLVTLRVVDNSGLSDTASQTLLIGAAAPVIARGFVVSPVDATHIRISVRGDASWFTPHRFRVTVFTDGTINEIRREPPSGAAPLAIVPTPTGGSQFEISENISNGQIDYIIGFTPNTTKIGLDLRLDLDGDGNLEQRRDFVWLTADGVTFKHPLSNPFVLHFPAGFFLQFEGHLRVCITFNLGPDFSVTLCIHWRDL